MKGIFKIVIGIIFFLFSFSIYSQEENEIWRTSNSKVIGSSKEGRIYIYGNENIDNSIRLKFDSTIVVVERRIEGIWQPSSFETGPNSLWVGPNVGISGFGHHLATETGDGHIHFHAHNEFEDGISTSETQILYAYNYQENIPIQPDSSGEWSGTNLKFDISPQSHSLLNVLSVKSGSIAATEYIQLIIRKDDPNIGAIILNQKYPASYFTEYTIVNLGLAGNVEFDIGANFYFEYSSSDTFSLKTNAAVDWPWAMISYSDVREDKLLQTAPYIDGETFTKGDYLIDSRKIYICNTTGVQTGTFASNAALWDLLSSTATDYWTKVGSALTYNDGTRDIVLIDTDGFKIYDNAGVDRFFIGDTFSQLRGETDAVGSRVLVSDISAALMYGTGHIKILDNAIQINDTNRTRLDIDFSKVRITAATGAGYFQMTDDALLYEDGNKDRLDITPILTTIHDEPGTGGGYLSLQSKEFTFVDGTVARIFTDALETTLVSPDNSTVVRVTDSGVKGVMTAAFVGGIEGEFSVARTLTYGGTGTSNLGITMPLAGRVTYMTLSVRANTSLTCTLRVNGIDSSDDISLVAEQTVTSTASTTFSAGDRVTLFKEGTTTADELVGTFFVEFDN